MSERSILNSECTFSAHMFNAYIDSTLCADFEIIVLVERLNRIHTYWFRNQLFRCNDCLDRFSRLPISESNTISHAPLLIDNCIRISTEKFVDKKKKKENNETKEKKEQRGSFGRKRAYYFFIERPALSELR